MKTYKIFNLVFAFIFAFSLLGNPALAAAQEHSPSIQVWVSGRVDGLNWPENNQISLHIENPSSPGSPTFDTTTPTFPCWWDGNQGCVNIDMGGFQFAIGQVMTMSDQNNNVRVYTITSLSLKITGIDAETDKVSGTADPNSSLSVNIGNILGAPSRYVTADAIGHWEAYFGDVGTGEPTFDIAPGTGIWVSQQDNDGDGISDYATVPALMVKANFEMDEIQAWGLENGTSVTLSIDDPATGLGEDYSETRNIAPPDWDPNQYLAQFRLQNIFDVQPGQIITVSGGGQSKTMTVADIWGITVDVDADTVSGYIVAGSNASVHVGANVDSGNLPVDGNGYWIADLSIVGTDIKPGSQGYVQVDTQDSGTTWIGFQVFNPSFTALFPWNRIDAYRWPMDAELTLTIDDPDNGTGVDYTETTTVGMENFNPPSDTWASFRVDGFELQPGQFITVTDGKTIKTHEVRYVTVTEVNPENDTITGTATPGAEVQIGRICDENGCAYRSVIASPDGNWLADLTDLGNVGGNQGVFDIRPGSKSDAFIADVDDDRTSYQWYVPDLPKPPIPSVDIDVTTNNAYASDWLVGTDVTISFGTILDNNETRWDYSKTVKVPSGWGGWCQFIINIDPADFRIQAGQVVKITDGVTTRQSTIPLLTVESVDQAADTISGYARAGGTVNLQAYYMSEPGSGNRNVVANGGGYWVADFAHPGSGDDEKEIFNINGSQGFFWISIPGDDYVSAKFQWGLGPTFSVVPADDQISTWGWPYGAVLTLTIDNPLTDTNPDLIRTQMVQEGDMGWGGEATFMNLGEILPDFIVSITDGTITKTHTVTPLAVTSVNTDTDTISGTAESGSRVLIGWLCGENGCAFRSETVVGGIWAANFTQWGDEGNEQNVFDIRAGTASEARQIDEDGDATTIRWRVMNPTITARTNYDTVEGSQWPVGATVKVEIDDPLTILKPDFTRQATVEITPGNPDETWFSLNLMGEYTLKPGDVITAEDGVTTRTHTVTSLTFTNLNPETDIVSGTAASNSQLYVWACGNNSCINREKTANQAGEWQTNFLLPGDMEWEQDTIDLQPGTWVDSAQYDDEGNATMYGRVVGSTISGTVYAIENIPGNEAGGVMIEACTEDLAFCRSAITNENGQYEVFGLAAGSYTVRAIPPGLNLPGRIGPIDVTYDEVVSGQVILLPAPPPPLPPDPIEPAHTGGGTISVYWQDILTLTAHGCAGGSADFEFIVLDDGYSISGTMSETPTGSGIYTATLLSLYPHHGAAQITYTILCPDNSTTVIPFFIYIDPSGVVKDVSGEPVSGATVTLLYSDNPDGPFNEVPEGSPMMSPSNRNNPDITNASGQFGWDVVAGFYKVRVEKAGCFASGNPAITYVESAVMSIPPAVTDLELILECQPVNTPPTDVVVTAPIAPQPISDFVSIQVAFNDPDDNDTHHIVIEWGDTTSTNITVTSLTAVAIHKYPAAGVYMVKATVTDAAGESAQGTFLYVVIYDPNGGYVTGGGWISSPLGAYAPNPTLTGKATFGFVSKYQKGANVPTGNTEFLFQVASLNFKSTSYDWLVIAGTKAQYKGTGTINGAGNYAFLLTATDGTLDKFRIKIWDKATGNIIYDNMIGIADGVDPMTVIGGGSIVVHK
jgi:hypothetical protein